MSEPVLIRHLKGESLNRFPVWMMRQAGRYLMSYQNIRKNHNFWEMVTTPELACDVSLQPVEQLGVDAVIFFSDILTLPYGFGVPIELKESVGPQLQNPLRDLDAFKRFEDFDPKKHTSFVGTALHQIREKMPVDKTLIGFAGTPWTVGSYLIEGRGSRDYRFIKGWMYRNPEEFFSALKYLADATERYLRYQVEQGAQAIQLFDSWISELPLVYFKDYYQSMMINLFASLKSLNVPLIYFPKHAQHLWSYFKEFPIDVLSVDSLLPLGEIERQVGTRFSLQGNLDPALLCQGTPIEVQTATRDLVRVARTLKRPAILNLGHGILKDTPVANVRAFVEEAQRPWN